MIIICYILHTFSVRKLFKVASCNHEDIKCKLSFYGLLEKLNMQVIEDKYNSKWFDIAIWEQVLFPVKKPYS